MILWSDNREQNAFGMDILHLSWEIHSVPFSTCYAPWRADLGRSPWPLASCQIQPIEGISRRLKGRKRVRSRCLFPISSLPGHQGLAVSFNEDHSSCREVPTFQFLVASPSLYPSWETGGKQEGNSFPQLLSQAIAPPFPGFTLISSDLGKQPLY